MFTIDLIFVAHHVIEKSHNLRLVYTASYLLPFAVHQDRKAEFFYVTRLICILWKQFVGLAPLSMVGYFRPAHCGFLGLTPLVHSSAIHIFFLILRKKGRKSNVTCSSERIKNAHWVIKGIYRVQRTFDAPHHHHVVVSSLGLHVEIILYNWQHRDRNMLTSKLIIIFFYILSGGHFRVFQSCPLRWISYHTEELLMNSPSNNHCLHHLHLEATGNN